MAEAGICPGDRELWRLQGLLSFPFSHSWSSVVFSDCKPLGNHCILTEHFWRLAQWKWLIQRRLDLPALQGHTLSRSIASQVPHLAAKKKNNVLVILIVSLMTMARIIIFGASDGCGGPWCQRKWRGTNPHPIFVHQIIVLLELLAQKNLMCHLCFLSLSSTWLMSMVHARMSLEIRNHRITHWFGMKNIVNMISSHSSHGQGHFQPDQDAQSPAQPCLEHFQGWGRLQGTLVSFRSLDILGFRAEDIPQMPRTARPWAGQPLALLSHALPLCPLVVVHCCCHLSLYRDSRALIWPQQLLQNPSQPLLGTESLSVLPTLLLWLAVANLTVLGHLMAQLPNPS